MILLILIGFKLYIGATEDRYCQTKHNIITKFPAELKTAADWLTLGDVDYESGSCDKAIEDLNMALKIKPNYAEAYNNLGYVQMRLQQYQQALVNFDKAIELRPNYPHALINRGDVYNYYFNIDRQKAIADYDRVISLGKDAIKGESVCGHRMMAVNNGNWLKTMWQMVFRTDDSGCLKMFFEK